MRNFGPKLWKCEHVCVLIGSAFALCTIKIIEIKFDENISFATTMFEILDDCT